MQDDSRQAGTENTEEIEITPEMIEAGISVLTNFNPCLDSGSEFVRELYLAMASHSNRGSKD